jgi:hypothetical protein
MHKLTYGDFIRTGAQDCENAISFEDFAVTREELSSPLTDRDLAVLVVKRELDTWDSEAWLKQQDDFESLDPATCYDAWRDGWCDQAIAIMTGHINRERAKLVDRIIGNASMPESWRAQ